jgi:ubiquinone/menaquinone biosynthesis C-methylase UbiE
VFTESARFYDALYGFKGYGAAVTYLRGVLDEAAPQAASLLDVGCGTGRHLQLLRDRYEVEGLDLNPALLDVARERRRASPCTRPI